MVRLVTRKVQSKVLVGLQLPHAHMMYAANALARLVLAASLSSSLALSARDWLFSGRTAPDKPLVARGASLPVADELSLGLLPCSVAELLLPGEARHLRVDDASLMAMIEDAVESHACCGLLLVGRGGDVTSVTSLLEIRACHPVDGGSAREVSLLCVGRVRVLDLQPAPPSAFSVGGYLRANVDLFEDDPEYGDVDEAQTAAALATVLAVAPDDETRDAEPPIDSEASAAAIRAVASGAQAAGVTAAQAIEHAQSLLSDLDGELRRAHDSARAKRVALKAFDGADEVAGGLSAPAADDRSLAEIVVARRTELLRLASASTCVSGDNGARGSVGVASPPPSAALASAREEAAKLAWLAKLEEGSSWRESLPTNVATSRATSDAATDCQPTPAPTLREAYGELWGGCLSESEAERQLLSFAAVAAVEPGVRVQMLFMQSATLRLMAALCALRETNRKLDAELALRRM